MRPQVMAGSVADWLRELDLDQYAQAFAENDIDHDVLPELTAEDLTALGITSIGHRRKLLAAIKVLQRKSRPAESLASPATKADTMSETADAPGAERRLLTILFCDLVGSTELSTRLDPEDMREIVGKYQACVREVMNRFSGFIAKYMGDGVLAYFGYPYAHEEDAEQAVRAGLAIVESVGRLELAQTLQVRIGIATGLVVVGDLIGRGASQEQAVIGETPNMAARLQSLASPNGIVIGEATRRQIGGLFELRDLGPQSLKGFTGTPQVWEVLSESSVASRFEALRSRSTSLVGREEEIDLLMRRWNNAKSGEGRIVLISAEPGIGKSRLTEALHERIAQEPHQRLRYFCSPHHQDSAFYPFIGHLEHASRFVRGDDIETRRRKLAVLTAPMGLANDDIMLLSDLLSLGTSNSDQELTPQQKKKKTFDILIRALETITRQQPALMIFEDVHWIDPTSRELLDLTFARIERLPVLVIATLRPEFQPPWVGQPHVTMMNLPRLDRRDGIALVRQLAGNVAALPADILDEIVERTDGVPLFLEEVTKAILETADTAGADDARSAVSAIPGQRATVPATLQASLMARLDRLGPAAREMAQTGAAIGREFSYDIVSSVTARPQPDVEAALARLVASGLVFQRGNPPAAEYQFKHALVQDTAYGTLLRGTRQALHEKIAMAIETRAPDKAEREPEILAYHYAEAGSAQRAAGYWLEAGRRAAARSANREAVAHLSRGIEIAASLPEGADAMRLELALQLALGPAVMSIRGFGAQEAEAAYRRSRQLAESLKDYQSLFAAIWGLWLTAGQSMDIDHRKQLVDELFEVAETLKDPALELQAHHVAWATLIFGGDLVKSQEHVRRGLALYDRKLHGGHALLYGGHDPAVCGAGQGALALWMLGYPNQATESGGRAIAFAADLGHQPSLAHALWFAGVAHMMRRDVEAALGMAEQIIALSRDHGLGQYQAIGAIMRGWGRARSGAVEEGLAEMREALDVHRANATVLVGFFATALAEAELLGGHIDEAAAALAVAVGTSKHEKAWASDIARVTGDLRLAQDSTAGAAAEEMYGQAISIARGSNAKSLELRAVLRLAQLQIRQGRQQKARELLQPVYSWFAEGLDTADLKEARDLLTRS
jgi:class 3 adenylate cyclase/tetratricopeptide (TPR) repeat protein